jgi:hypothetical protein
MDPSLVGGGRAASEYRHNPVSSKLAHALLTEAAPVHPDVVAFKQAAERYHRECVDALNDGDRTGYTERWAPTSLGIQPAAQRSMAAPGLPVRSRKPPRAGVRVLLDRVISGETRATTSDPQPTSSPISIARSIQSSRSIQGYECESRRGGQDRRSA